MQKVTKEQIEYLQTLCDNLKKSWYSIEDKKGLVLKATQSLKDIDYFSLFYQNISNIRKEYKTSFDFNEPRTILESAINHYKTQIIETSKEQYKSFHQPTIIEKPKVTERRPCGLLS